MALSYRDLAREYGTPSYVYDGARLTEAMRRLRTWMHAGVEVFYSLKANPNVSVFGLLRAHGARAEVCSLGELRTALMAGAVPDDIVFLGPGKGDEDLVACLETGVYAIVCEAFDELDRIEYLAGERGLRQRVLLRINPATAAAGARLAMGGKPRQFGIDEAAVLAEKDLAHRYRNVDLAGVQVYAGTRILDWRTVVANTRYTLDLAERVATVTGMRLDAVDIGGGFGVPYFSGEDELDLAALAEEMNPLIDVFLDRHSGTRIILESGRYLTADSGVYLVAVRSVKESLGKRFAVTDGGTHHHLAAVGLGSPLRRNFPISLVGSDDEPSGEWNVTGLLCTPDDTLGKGVALPDLKPGDVLGVHQSGAYGLTASPGLFLSHGFPAEVLVHDGRSYLIRARDEQDDLLRKQLHYDFDRR
ncbi:type III PLP-dependent enzyme [Streptosporangium saharense]|uniref:type III PLP-dependent enzyme n=1 Tax=Streptosporangium saharense TaxID=1706840 RepID=UPI0033250BBC